MSIPVAPDIHSQEQERSQFTEHATPIPTHTPRSSWFKWLKLTFKLGCTIALFVFLLRSVDLKTTLTVLQHMDSGGLLIGVVVGLMGVIISAYQWQRLLDAEGILLDLRRLINLYLVGIAFNNLLPTGMGGDIVKVFYTGKASGNTTGAASAAFMSRMTGFCGMLLLSVPALLIWHGTFAHELSVAFLLSCLAMCGALGGIFLLILLLPKFVRGTWQEQRIVKTLLQFGLTLRKSLKQPRALCSALTFGALFHLSSALNYYAFATLLHIQIPLTFYLVAIPFVSLVAFLPIAINGFGLREGTFVYIFATMHVPSALALALVFLVDIEVIAFGLLGGCIYLLMGARQKRHSSREPDASIVHPNISADQ